MNIYICLMILGAGSDRFSGPLAGGVVRGPDAFLQPHGVDERPMGGGTLQGDGTSQLKQTTWDFFPPFHVKSKVLGHGSCCVSISAKQLWL